MSRLNPMFRRILTGICLVLLAASCGPKAEAPGPLDRAAPAADADPTDDPIADNYSEGSRLPEGWPADLIPLPEGSSPIASLNRTTLEGVPGEARAVFYSSPLSSGQIFEFLQRELPKNGWKIIDSASVEDFSVLTAQGHGYVGYFSSGAGVGPASVSSGEKIALQVILASGA